jgi:hypothetical protein
MATDFISVFEDNASLNILCECKCDIFKSIREARLTYDIKNNRISWITPDIMHDGAYTDLPFVSEWRA